jgi:hypothetical protein
MKWHLNVILAIINFSIFGYFIYCLIWSIAFFAPLMPESLSTVQFVVREEYFSKGVDVAPAYVGMIFIFLNLLVHLYLFDKLLLARKIVSKIYSGEIIYQNQSSDLKKVASGFIIFAKIKYSLLMITGVFFYADIHIFVTALPQFLLFYLLGKLILVIAIISSKSEILQQENDLTV